jgi:hypothetical protein
VGATSSPGDEHLCFLQRLSAVIQLLNIDARSLCGHMIYFSWINTSIKITGPYSKCIF